MLKIFTINFQVLFDFYDLCFNNMNTFTFIIISYSLYTCIAILYFFAYFVNKVLILVIIVHWQRFRSIEWCICFIVSGQHSPQMSESSVRSIFSQPN